MGDDSSSKGHNSNHILDGGTRHANYLHLPGWVRSSEVSPAELVLRSGHSDTRMIRCFAQPH